MAKYLIDGKLLQNLIDAAASTNAQSNPDADLAQAILDAGPIKANPSELDASFLQNLIDNPPAPTEALIRAIKKLKGLNMEPLDMSDEAMNRAIIESQNEQGQHLTWFAGWRDCWNYLKGKINENKEG